MLPLVYSNLGCPDWTFEESADAAVANGYAGLEIRLLDGGIIPADLSKARQAEVRQIMADRELVIAGLGASTKFSSTDPEVRKANQDELRQYLQLANALEAPMVRTFGGNVEEGSTIDDAINWVAENLAALADEAQRQGVTILLETHDAFCKGAQVAPALKQVDHPNVQAVWDVHHPYRMGETVEETWALIGPYVKHVHLKDAQTHDDGSFTLVLMGEGDVPNYEVVKLLLENGYDGYLAAEWEKKWHPTIEEPEIAIPQHAEVIRGWLVELGNE